MKKSRIHIFKDHLRQAKKAGWTLYSILHDIVTVDTQFPELYQCPFDCPKCPRNEECKNNYIKKNTIWRKCLVFPHKLQWYKSGTVKSTCWSRQEDWYHEVEDREALKEIAEEVWDE